MTDESGPAFPCDDMPGYSGLTIRDYFAGQALAGYLATADVMSILNPEAEARTAYEIADAMLRERDK